jgi:hypothetical protein
VTETFPIRNDAHKPREYTLPDVLELRRLGPDGLETDAVVFARAQFTPDRACVPAKGQCQVQLTIPWDPRLGDGATTRYRACVLLEADGTPAAEFIVELLYETPPTPAAAPAGASAPKGKPQK